jgi:hypothetical protein
MNGYSTRKLWYRIVAFIAILIVFGLLLLGSGFITPARAATVIMVPNYWTPVEVRSETPISVAIYDANMTPVNDVVTFDTFGKSAFVLQNGTYVQHLVVDAQGLANAIFYAGHLGTNYVVASSGFVTQTIVISTTNTAPPAKIIYSIQPTGLPFPWVYADGISDHYFTITYTVFDAYGDITMSRPITFSTNIPTDTQTLKTNNLGKITVTYGPKVTAGRYTIHMTSVDNSSATVSHQVDFVSTYGMNAFLTANPQSMPSRDVRSDMASNIIAKVYDARGNPVLGETVNFRMVSYTNGTTALTSNPDIDGAGVGILLPRVSNGDGEAIVSFHPGAFTVNRFSPGYSQTATGTALLEANWNGTVRQITVEFKNYPYLSIETTASPLILDKNESVDITIRLTGDGWALRPKPIDVMLVNDRSGSMLKDFDDRMVNVMGASKVFNTQFDYSRDRMGLVTFGKNGLAKIESYDSGYDWVGHDSDSHADDCQYIVTNYPADGAMCNQVWVRDGCNVCSHHQYYSGGHWVNHTGPDCSACGEYGHWETQLGSETGKSYSDYATMDSSLSSDNVTLGNIISNMVPNSGTPMRYGIYKAIKELKTNGYPSSYRAIVVLSDGDYNWYGDPLARGTGYSGSTDPTGFSDLTTSYIRFSDIANQSMVAYANENNVKIFTIAFATDISSGGRSVLQQLATQTGGTYYYAPSASDLAGIYVDIAGKLKIAAGVDTQMSVDMNTVTVNDVSTPGYTVFAYKYVPGISTRIHSWNATHEIISPYTIDQQGQWNQNHSLMFNVGTIYLGQIWESKYRLVTDGVTGTVNLFGPTSYITFDDGSRLKIPDTFVNIIDKSQNVGAGATNISIHNLTQKGQIPAYSQLTVTWDVEFKGNSSVKQFLYIETEPNQWHEWWRGVSQMVTGNYQTNMIRNVLNHPPNGTFRMKVEAYAENGGWDEVYGNVSLWDNNLPKIKLT